MRSQSILGDPLTYPFNHVNETALIFFGSRAAFMGCSKNNSAFSSVKNT